MTAARGANGDGALSEPMPHLDVMRADDLLLDELGHGGQPDGDPIAAMLGAWRADLDDELAWHEAARPEGDGQPHGGALPDSGALRDGSAFPGSTAFPGGGALPGGSAEAGDVLPGGGTRGRHGTGRSRWRSRSVRVGVGAAVVLVVAGGTSVAAASAGPGSPLWPITRIVNPQRAGTADVEQELDRARQAIADGRLADARQLLDRAEQLLARVHDPNTVARLRAELDALRASADAVVPGAPRSSSGSSRATPTPMPAPGGGGGASGTPTRTPGPSPTPSPSASTRGGLLPILPLPTGLLPSLPLGLDNR